MKTVIFGKKVKNTYVLEGCREWKNGELKFCDEPGIRVEKSVVEFIELCSFEGDLKYNNNYYFAMSCGHNNKINISEDETVCIEKEIFRADLNELHVFTDKVTEIVEENRDVTEKEYTRVIREFNEQMIKSNETMKLHCDVYKLNYEDTDCFDLFNLIYPNKNYEIVDGEMKVKEEKLENVPSVWVTSNQSNTNTMFVGSCKTQK